MRIHLAIALIPFLFGCTDSQVRIIHVKNWHWVPRESFAVELKDRTPGLTDAEIDDRYARFLDDVEELQSEQVDILRGLIHARGIKPIFNEGVTAENRDTSGCQSTINPVKSRVGLVQ